jgi:hypothetical protein
VPVAQTDDSLRVAGDYPPDDCRVDSVADDYSAPGDCPAEADSPQDYSCPDARSLLVDFLPADCRGDFRRPEVAAAWPAER